MRQFSCTIRRPEDVPGCIERARANLPETYKSLLITVFTTATDHLRILELTRQLDAAFPASVIAGCTTTDIIRQGSVNVNATVVSFSAFQSSQVRIASFNDADTLSEDGKTFIARVKRVKNLAAVGLLGTLHSLDIQPFLNRLGVLEDKVVIFGGGANTNQNMSASVFTKSEVMGEGLIAIVYSGPELFVHASLNFGWKPLGREFVITKMTGSHVVEEIDKQPAIRIYERYLGILPDKNFQRDTLAFPVFVRRGGSNVARHPVGFREDGSLLFVADLHEGEKIRLAYGDPREMIEDAKAGYADMARFRPEGLFILSCYAHRMFLRGDVKFELAPARDIAPSDGFYTYGEIFRFGRNIGIHNMMILTVGFREGNMPREPLPVRGEMPSRFKDSLLLVERLVRFVGATTAELENLNVELDRLARTDRLTQISNRGETEILLKEAVEDAAKNDAPLSVVMLDLDDFKKINDIYGHAFGDKVLTATSNVLRAQVRQGDTVGRWGGEEFLLILANVDEKTAERIADRIRKAVAALHILPGSRGFTASFGVARIVPGEPFKDIYQRVDAALYEAKRDGKNCVRIAPTPKMES